MVIADNLSMSDIKIAGMEYKISTQADLMSRMLTVAENHQKYHPKDLDTYTPEQVLEARMVVAGKLAKDAFAAVSNERGNPFTFQSLLKLYQSSQIPEGLVSLLLFCATERGYRRTEPIAYRYLTEETSRRFHTEPPLNGADLLFVEGTPFEEERKVGYWETRPAALQAFEVFAVPIARSSMFKISPREPFSSFKEHLDRLASDLCLKIHETPSIG